MEEKRYTIGGKTYFQRTLVLIQIKQLKKALSGIEFPENLSVLNVIETLGDRIPQALAIVLTEEGTALKGKDLSALAEELEYSIEAETVFTVIEDFFTCNPTASLLQKLAGMLGSLRGMMTKRTGSTSSASPSPEETLPSETPSSGATPSESASLT
ncbi:MAG: hypothetical protein AB9919_06935 [Geobacteraceae bacterium]